MQVTEELLAEITRRLVAELQPEEIILFGSHAWGVPDEDSDVDLLLVMPPAPGSRAEQELRARRCLRGIGVPKDVLVRTPSEMDYWSRASTSLEADILQRGKVLYARSDRGIGPELARKSAA